MTQQQIKWASGHNWFVRDNGNGTITVIDRTLDPVLGMVEVLIQPWEGTFVELRAWAGY